ncbi:MAG: hypothetical protein JXP34_16515 [Planctomycetes bacterium]|nr:hypothetical protein [Planctomycetota bacterium]
MAHPWMVAAAFCLWSAARAAGPVAITTTNDYGGTMGIPRWKMACSANDPNTMWLVFAKRADNLIKSSDGGATWGTTAPAALTISSYLDFHVAMWADDVDRLHLCYPAYSESLGYHVAYRQVSPPGETSSDLSEPVVLRANTPSRPSAAIAASGSDVFVFTRAGVSASENIRYFLSRDGGGTWPVSGQVDSLNRNVRIGATVWEQAPIAVVWIQEASGATEYRYYRWDGSAFVRPADSTIALDNDNRFFSFNVVQGRTFHLVFSDAQGLLTHRWKDWSGGTGTWQQSVVADLGGTTYYYVECYPHLIVHGADLYVMWSQRLTADTVRTIYWSKWDGAAWSPGTRLTSSSNNCKQCNAPRVVDAGASALPVVWTEGTSDPYLIFFATIPATSQSGAPTRGDLDRRITSFEEGATDAARVLEDADRYQKGE